MKVLIAGANGKVGTILSGKLWAAHGFSPVALIRNSQQQMKFTALGVPAVTGDLEEGVGKYLPGLDAVVFTAGSGGHTGPEKTIDVDQNAAIRLMKDCEKEGVKRFIMVSAIGADPASESTRIQNYLRAKGVADGYLRSTRLGCHHPCPRYLAGRKRDRPDSGFRETRVSWLFAERGFG
jgi:uncharacterized protein YbjT (DUF2867 family)